MENIHFYGWSVLCQVLSTCTPYWFASSPSGVGQQLVCSFPRTARSPLSACLSPEPCMCGMLSRHVQKGPGLSLPVDRSLGNNSRDGLTETWRKLGNKEMWRRGMCVGPSEGVENIKIRLFHINAQEELAVY